MAQGSIRSTSKRDSLVVAAERLMLQRGYWGTSVDDVCKAAAVSKGSFFYHFRDKEQLALAALDLFVGRMVQRIKEAVAVTSSRDALDTICTYCELIATVVHMQKAQEGCLIATIVLETRASDGAFADRCSLYLRQWIELLRQQFAAALATKRSTKPELAAELAQLCVCTIEGALIVARGRRDPAVVDVAMRRFQHYVKWLIRGGGEGRSPTAPPREAKNAQRLRRRGRRGRMQ